MPSRSASIERNRPQQKRSALLLERLLDAAEAVFAECGYEAATMTAIAENAGTSIGGLYRYYPDKVAVAQALFLRYAEQSQSHWTELIAEAKDMPPDQFSDRLLAQLESTTTKHPAYLALISAPLKFSRDASAKRSIRMVFSKAFQAKNPVLSADRAYMISNTVIQIIKGRQLRKRLLVSNVMVRTYCRTLALVRSCLTSLVALFHVRLQVSVFVSTLWDSQSRILPSVHDLTSEPHCLREARWSLHLLDRNHSSV
ncbi:TetR/AcrR family transcriptional regulator [Tunturiibacter lichenicola]|jgi:AcrR family transcriptional regulator|uniref:TetR/AcrR family transcriptional regulator n=1 Tax=Tunturiibacter lichenicola TaxID=2051959 RepID=UPI003D9AFC70